MKNLKKYWRNPETYRSASGLVA